MAAEDGEPKMSDEAGSAKEKILGVQNGSYMVTERKCTLIRLLAGSQLGGNGDYDY